MMHLFSLIADQVRNKKELFDEEGRIMQQLVSVGYHFHEADAALTLMQAFVKKQDETFFGAGAPARMRTMSSEERARFTIEAFSFAVKLGHLGVISEDQREELIEKAMNAYTGRIQIDHVKTLAAFLLFANSREYEETTFSPSSRRTTAWN
jgi:uncharacterized protein Smg (DUF494 family)